MSSTQQAEKYCNKEQLLSPSVCKSERWLYWLVEKGRAVKANIASLLISVSMSFEL
jgi:hypothetical protein